MNFSTNSYPWVSLHSLDFESVSNWVLVFPDLNPPTSVNLPDTGSVWAEVGAWGCKIEEAGSVG